MDDNPPLLVAGLSSGLSIEGRTVIELQIPGRGSLGPENDVDTLKTAAPGIAVMGPEGAA